MRPSIYRRCIPLLLLLFGTACSDDDPVSFFIEPPCMAFAPAGTGNLVTRVGSISSCDVASVDVAVSGLSGVFGASFTVQYNASIVRYLEFSSTESFLAADGASLLVQAEERTGGQIVVGISRSGSPVGVDPTAGEDVLISLVFVRVAGGNASGELSLINAEIDAPGQPPVPLCGGTSPACAVGSGTFTVTQ